MPLSVHSHSGEFCKHGDGALGAMVAQAAAMGFECYGLSEHMPRHELAELYPEEVRARQQ